MIRRLFNACLCQPGDLRPSRDDLEIVGTFNPGAIAFGDEVIMLARVAERPRERREGYTALPRWHTGAGLTVDWIANDEIDSSDARVVRRKRDGLVRLTSASHLRILHSGDGRSIDREDDDRFEPHGEFEEFGVEDPRITRIGDKYWFTYVAVSRHGPATSLASTTDFQTFTRHGVIFPIENKDVVLLPEQIDGEYVALHRPLGGTPFTQPEIWLARSGDMIHWGRHEIVLGSVSSWDAGRVGAGAPPIRSSDGWLEIYHGCARPTDDSEVGAYSAGALLLDFDEPHRIVRKSSEPILVPEADFEREGFVPNVVFPTGVIDLGDTLLIYYGAADTVCAVAELPKADVLAATR
ncbi:MAG: glycoside hydrolase family 130 protein [Planctomycetota bacterium]